MYLYISIRKLCAQRVRKLPKTPLRPCQTRLTGQSRPGGRYWAQRQSCLDRPRCLASASGPNLEVLGLYGESKNHKNHCAVIEFQHFARLGKVKFRERLGRPVHLLSVSFSMLFVALGRCWAPHGALTIAKGLKKEGHVDIWILYGSHKSPKIIKLDPQGVKIRAKV